MDDVNLIGIRASGCLELSNLMNRKLIYVEK